MKWEKTVKLLEWLFLICYNKKAESRQRGNLGIMGESWYNLEKNVCARLKKIRGSVRFRLRKEKIRCG